MSVIGAVIVAAGSARRMGGIEKTQLPLCGKNSLLRVADTFDACDKITHIVIVARADACESIRTLLQGRLRAECCVVPGGATRQESVCNGLGALPQNTEYVLIHDAARPLVTGEVILRILDGVFVHGSAVAGMPVKDTIKVVASDGSVVETPPRDTLWQVQTPQAFLYEKICRAHEAARCEGFCATDDAALLEHAGEKVYMVEASYENLKITTEEDIAVAEALLQRREPVMLLPRVGQGFDAHRLVEGRPLILGGVTIPYDKGLLGHSDADVLTHALMDALLGAAALGDIGTHFPDTDERYRGISSITLLEHVCTLLAEKGFSIGNVHATLIAQKPRIAPYLPQMRKKLAAAMGVAEAQVALSATTTEKMGFTGDGSGMAATAVAMLQGPRVWCGKM